VYEALKWGVDRGISLDNMQPMYAGETNTDKVLALLVIDRGMEYEATTIARSFTSVKDVECISSNKVVSSTLIEAAEAGYVEVARCLIERGAILDQCDEAGSTPLLKAASHGQVEMVDALLKLGASVSLRNLKGETPLHMAAYKGHIDVVRRLLKEPEALAMIDQKADTLGWSPLLFSAREGHTEVVNVLLAAGADPNFVDNYAETPLHWAAWMGRVGVVRALVAARAKVDMENVHSESCLHIASCENNLEIMSILLAAGSNPNLCNAEYQTPLYRPAIKGLNEAIRILIDAGAQQFPDINGITPLHKASFNGYTTVVHTLVAAFPDSIELKDSFGNTPLALALDRHHTDVVIALQAAGATVIQGLSAAEEAELQAETDSMFASSLDTPSLKLGRSQ
jgi:ankyrin repeat protein